MEQITLEQAILNENIETYFKLKAQVDELNAKIKTLNSQIVAQMEENGDAKYSNDEYTATITYKNSIKYNDEKALIEILKKDYEFKIYVGETIDSKALNDVIKNSERVSKRLQESYTNSTTSALSIKKN